MGDFIIGTLGTCFDLQWSGVMKISVGNPPVLEICGFVSSFGKLDTLKINTRYESLHHQQQLETLYNLIF